MKQRVLVLGGGFGGVAAARHLTAAAGGGGDAGSGPGADDLEVRLINRTNFLTYTPFLADVAGVTIAVGSQVVLTATTRPSSSTGSAAMPCPTTYSTRFRN